MAETTTHQTEEEIEEASPLKIANNEKSVHNFIKISISTVY